MSVSEHIEYLIKYLHEKIAARDWPSVIDAANVLRLLESRVKR